MWSILKVLIYIYQGTYLFTCSQVIRHMQVPLPHVLYYIRRLGIRLVV